MDAERTVDADKLLEDALEAIREEARREVLDAILEYFRHPSGWAEDDDTAAWRADVQEHIQTAYDENF
jgi:hypothetical protein